MPDQVPDAGSEDLQTKTYKFTARGTRPVLQFELSGGTGSKGEPERLTIELHSPMSGEVFEAKTSKGRLEVDSDGRVMYFSQAPDKVSFTLFLGRSLIVTMSRKSGEVTIQTPSKMLSVEKLPAESGEGAAPSDAIRLVLD